MTTIRKTYTTEFKVKVVREILREEKSLSQIASEYGTHTNVICVGEIKPWLACQPSLMRRLAHDQAAQEAEWEKEREGFYSKIGRLSTQLSWLKKRWESDRACEERVNLVDWQREELDVKTNVLNFFEHQNAPFVPYHFDTFVPGVHATMCS